MKGIFLNTDRTYKEVKIPGNAHEVIYNRGLYAIDPRRVRHLIYKDKIKNSVIIWFQSNPDPIPEEKGEHEDFSLRYMDHTILKNAIEQAGEPTKQTRTFHIGRPQIRQIVIGGAGILIVGAVIWGFIFG